MAKEGGRPVVLAAFDIETVPDPLAEGLVAFAPPSRRAHAALHRIDAFAWIGMTETPSGDWKVDWLVSDGDETGEFDLLMRIDGLLRDLRDRDGELCTWNGSRHDLPVLRRRATHHWMFELDGLFPETPVNHRDLLTAAAGTRAADWPKLREACAGVGIGCNPTPKGVGLVTDPRIRKAEVDAIATLLLRLHELAGSRSDRATLVRAWSALVAFIKDKRPLDAHLVQFTRSVALEGAIAYDARKR